MIVTHLIVAFLAGALAAGWVWLGQDASIWTALLTYIVVGNLACLASVGLAIVVALMCPGYRRADNWPTADAESACPDGGPPAPSRRRLRNV